MAHGLSGKHIYVDKDGVLVVSNSKYTPEQILEAAAAYVAFGNLHEVSRYTNIPVRTLSDWKHSEFWSTIVQKILAEQEDEMRANWQRIAKKAQKAALERLEEGDVKFDSRTGQHVNVPVTSKDAGMLAAISYDKQRLSQNLPTKITEARSSEELKKFAEAFEDIAEEARKNKAANTMINGEEAKQG